MDGTEVLMSPVQLLLLQHSLGVDEYGMGNMYRNYFCAGGKDEVTCRELVDLGYMVDSGPNQLMGGMSYFHVTEEGKVAVKNQSPKPPKLSRGALRYRTYLRSECDESFIDWLRNPYWDDYRKSAGL